METEIEAVRINAEIRNYQFDCHGRQAGRQNNIPPKRNAIFFMILLLE